MEGQNVIRKSLLAGNSSPVNITEIGVQVIELSVDIVTETLYLVTENAHVCSSNYNGDNRVCFQYSNGEVVSGIVVFEVFIYLSLRDSNSLVQIQRDLGILCVVFGHVCMCVCLRV